MERTLTTIPAVNALSMIFAKFTHSLSVDDRIFVSLNDNKKMTDSGISNKPFCNAPTSIPVFPSCTAKGDKSDRWMCLDVLVNETFSECLLSLQVIQLIRVCTPNMTCTVHDLCAWKHILNSLCC